MLESDILGLIKYCSASTALVISYLLPAKLEIMSGFAAPNLTCCIQWWVSVNLN